MSVTTRPLEQHERTLLDDAMLVAANHAPYFGLALWRLRPVAAESLGTFAVDRGWRLYLDPATLTEWGAQLSGGVLVHEVSHLIRQHAIRGDALGANRNHEVWNYATDAAINADLVAANITLPGGAVTPEALGLPANGVEEDYYAALAPQQPHSQQPETGCGSGAGDASAEWELSDDDTSAPAMPASQADLTRRQVAQQVSAARAGTVSGGLRRWAEATLAPAQINWRHRLRATVRQAVNHRRGMVDYTYARPGRRQHPKMLSPGMIEPVVTIAVVVDTSASMAPAQISAAMSEVRSIIASTGARLTIAAVDARAHVQTVTSIDDLDLRGGGGTDMRVGIEAVRVTRPRPDVIVVLTDGFTPWPERPTRERLIVALIGKRVGEAPGWAHSVRVRV